MTRGPLPRLVTERLVVRPPGPSDAARVARYWRANEAFHARSSPVQREEFYTDAFWEERIPSLAAERRRGESLRVFLFDPREERVLGHASLTRITRGAFHAANLGYSLDRRAEGRGLMTEALRALLAHAFGPMGLHRVEANHLPSNRRSAAVLRRLGFRREGLARDYLLIDGRWQDHVLNSLTNREWIAPGASPESGRPPRRGAGRPSVRGRRRV
ncbi:MAG: GNAT family N-acetyltransferase [Planctomycetes bacterium]|nr:GNAT family N-acetyltransferase [Planctomycetota bacterium]